MPTLQHKAEQYLRQAINNPSASFRDGQWEAIRALVEDRAQLLVVQRTGWGKSMVYFLATRLLRDGGAGPTLLVSPLLSLMRNQIAAAERIGIRAATINSENSDEWDEVNAQLRRNEVDILLISPERLSNPDFRNNVLAHITSRVGLFVVDEAHCISDWGHDFRPDYRRLVGILQAIMKGKPLRLPVLATTATANNRVVDDVVEQLGALLRIVRGPLARESLRLQAIELPSQAERLAWLAEQLPRINGYGIIYTRTVRDSELVAAWLQHRGINALPYHAKLSPDRNECAALREEREQLLLDNKVKALVATVALGMGFDKPDLAFVIHYQRPGSVVEYYQQVGRAGRNGADAYGIILSGVEDDDITDFFIRNAFPPAHHIDAVLEALENADNGLRLTDLEDAVNLSRSQLQKVLKNLDVLSPSPIALLRDGRTTRYHRTRHPYRPDTEHSRRLEEIRRREQDELREYMKGDVCHMAYLRTKLDDDVVEGCGRCAVCTGHPLLPIEVSEDLVRRAVHFLKHSYQPITPRKKWPDYSWIPAADRAEEGRALCIYGDAGWGRLVKRGKYHDGYFDDELVEAVAEMIRDHWHPDPMPTCVVCVPSRRHPELVPAFAARLARRLRLPFVKAIEKVRDTDEQKEMNNSHYRLENLRDAFAVEMPPRYHGHDVLLVDDMLDSGWTFTYLAALLRQHGAGRVYPVALAVTTTSD